MSPPSSPLIRSISAFRSGPSTSELLQVGSVSVEETTYFFIEFILSAKPASSCMSGQALAKPSYVTRPSSCASWSKTSWSLNAMPSSSLNWKVQPPCW